MELFPSILSKRNIFWQTECFFFIPPSCFHILMLFSQLYRLRFFIIHFYLVPNFTIIEKTNFTLFHAWHFFKQDIKKTKQIPVTKMSYKLEHSQSSTYPKSWIRIQMFMTVCFLHKRLLQSRYFKVTWQPVGSLNLLFPHSEATFISNAVWHLIKCCSRSL